MQQGLDCYHSGQFFEAHEYWEELWRPADGDDRILLQSLIQLTVAFCHRQRGNDRGYRSLLTKSMERLNTLPSDSNGVRIAPLKQNLQTHLNSLDDYSASLDGFQDAPPDLRLYLPLK